MTKRPLLCGVAAFVIGERIGAEPDITMGLGIGMLFFLGTILLYWREKKEHSAKSFFFILVLLFFGLGMMNGYRCQIPNELRLLAAEEPDTVWRLEGKVIGIQRNEQSRILLVQTERIEGNKFGSTKPYRIRLYETIAGLQGSEFCIGNRIQCEMELMLPEAPRNPGEFNSLNYYRARGIDGLGYTKQVVLLEDTRLPIRHGLYRIQAWGTMVLEHYLSESNSVVMSAILLGSTEDLDSGIRKLYQRNGISHILAISALHISIIGGTLYRLLRRMGVSYLKAGLPVLLLLLLYGVLTGGSTSTIRAILMFGISVIGDICGRTYDMLTALGIACLCILIQNPYQLWDAGFLLSFSAVLSLGVLVPEVKSWFETYPSKGVKRYLADGLLSGFLLQLGTAPVMVYFYYDYSLYGILLNLIVIPLMTPILICGFLGLLLYSFLPGLGGLILTPCDWILSLFQWMCQVTEQLPGASIPVGCPTFWELGFYYGGLFILGLLLRKHRIRLALFILCFLMLGFFLVNPSDLRITMLDVGQGDSILIETPGHKFILIDGGSSSRSSVGEYVITPAVRYYGSHRLDYVFVSHIDRDHVNGIQELIALSQNGGIRIGCLMIPAATAEGEFQELIQQAEQAGIQVQVVDAGDRLVVNEMELSCLYPIADEGNGYSVYSGDSNNSSMVLSLSYKNFDMLFTGDLEEEGERRMLQSSTGLLEDGYDVLKVGHHGSSGASSQVFLEQVRPAFALISCGKDNRYGHPHQETLDRLEAVGSQFFTTAEQGAIEMRTNGRRMEYYFFLKED